MIINASVQEDASRPAQASPHRSARAPKHSKPRAKRSSWDTGPPPAATDAQGKSGDIRQPLAVGEWIVAVDATAVARLQVEKDTALIRGPPDTPETLTIAPAAVGIPPCDTAPARTPVPRKRTHGRHERPVRAHKSRSPQEISALVDFIMAHPDSAVDAPRGQAQRSGVSTNLIKTFHSDWQTFLTGDFHRLGHHLFDPKLRPGGKSEHKTTSTHES